MEEVLTPQNSRSIGNKFTLMWKDAEDDFEARTGKRLVADKKTNSSSNLIDQFIAKLAPEDSDDRSDRKRRKAAQIVGFVLDFVQTMGGLASQTASMAFGPADMCLNAFSFLIDIPKKIGKVYDDLIQLFGDMSATLLEFQVLEKILAKAEIEVQLMTTTHAILIAFVGICGRYIKFLEGGKIHRFTVAFRSVFLDDDCGVLDELKNFKNLARQQSSMIGTVSYRHVLDIEEAIHQYGTYQPRILGHVETLVASENDRKTEILLQSSLKSIEQKLYGGDSTADASLAALANTQKKAIDDACHWLYDTPEYRTWVNIGSKKHMLCIAGGPKSGRTFLVAATARELERPKSSKSVQGSAPRVLYYSFPRSHEKSPKDRDAVNLALKVLAIQYARKNQKYAQHLEKSLNSPDPQFEDLPKLWTTLKFHNLLETSDRPVYILLSGLDRVDNDRVQELLGVLASNKGTKTRNLKIFVTGAISTFANMGNSALIINVGDHNEAGINHFIQSKISKVEMLQDRHPSIKRLRSSLLDQLPKKVDGSFFAVERKLELVINAIDNNKTHDEVLDVLNESLTSDSRIAMRNRIEDLEKSLTSNEIDDLNVILAWLVYGFSSPTTRELEAMLLLHRKSQPVMPLEKRLRRKYSTILELSDDFVDLVEGLSDFFKDENNQTQQNSSQQSNISLSIAMTENDRPAVKRFLWDLTQKFSFDDPLFMSCDPGLRRPRIGVDEVNAHFDIIDKCFYFLSEDNNPDTQSLVNYSMRYLPSHLKESLHLSLSGDQKGMICQRLISFFSDPDALERKWRMGYKNQLQWMEQSTFDVIEAWFGTTGHLVQPIERRWIKENVSKKGSRGAFWLPITEMIAKKWLRSREWSRHIEVAFRWVDGFIELQSNPAFVSIEQPNTNKSISDDTMSDPGMTSLSVEDRINRAAKWATSLLKLDINALDALFYERLALTFLEVKQVETAIKFLSKADSLDSSDLRIHKHLADAYEQINEHEKAKEHLRVAVEDPQFSLRTLEQKQASVVLLRQLAAAEQKSGNNEAALRYHEQVLDAGSLGSAAFRDSFWKCFELLFRTGQSERARDMLYGDSDQQPEAACKALSQLLRVRVSSRIGNFVEISYYLSRAAEERRIATVVEAAFHQLITQTGQAQDSLGQAYQFWSASIVFGNSTIPNAREKGLEYLEDCFSTIHQGLHDRPDRILESSFRFVRVQAMEQLSLWRSLALTQTLPSHPDLASDWEDFMTTITSALKLPDYSSYKRQETPATYLCRHYVLAGKHDQARALMKSDVQDALVLLEDDDSDNHTYGYLLLAEAHKCSGDDVNALTAWSLVAPTDLKVAATSGQNSDEHDDAKPVADMQKGATTPSEAPAQKPTERPGNLSMSCDGGCDTTWTYADDFWSCKFCPDLQFCCKCHDLLKRGELQRLVCHREHDFLHIPPWSDAAYLELGAGRVRVGGHVDSDKGVDRPEPTSVREWLDTIRKDWNIGKTQ